MLLHLSQNLPVVKGSLGASIFKQADLSAIGVRKGGEVYGEF